MEILKNIFKKNDINYTLLRYTYSAWMKCYTDSNYSEWRMRMCPENVYDFIDTQIKMFGLKDKKVSYRVITIDDDYFKWLKDKGLENNAENISEYSVNVDDETALLKMKKAGFDIIYEVLYLPIFVIKYEAIKNKKTDFILQDDLKNRIKKYLETYYKHASVYVPGYLLRPDVASYNEERILDISKLYFEEGKEITLKAWETQDYPDEEVNLFSLYMPFIIRYPIEEIEFKSDELFTIKIDTAIEQDPTAAIMTEECIETLKLKGVDPLNNTTFANDMLKEFNAASVTIVPTPIFSEEIKENEQQVLKTLFKNKIKVV